MCGLSGGLPASCDRAQKPELRGPGRSRKRRPCARGVRSGGRARAAARLRQVLPVYRVDSFERYLELARTIAIAPQLATCPQIPELVTNAGISSHRQSDWRLA